MNKTKFQLVYAPTATELVEEARKAGYAFRLVNPTVYTGWRIEDFKKDSQYITNPKIVEIVELAERTVPGVRWLIAHEPKPEKTTPVAAPEPRQSSFGGENSVDLPFPIDSQILDSFVRMAVTVAVAVGYLFILGVFTDPALIAVIEQNGEEIWVECARWYEE
jgi:hypothetical protein